MQVEHRDLIVRRAVRPGRALRRAALQFLQKRPRPHDYPLRQARHLCDLDAVAVVCCAGDDLAEEDHLVLALFHRDVEVLHARQLLLDVGQLVIVRREERFRAELFPVGAVFEHRARNGHPVERRRAAANFVQNEQGIRRCVFQNVGDLVHLDHERRLAGRQIVRRADAREQLVHDADARRARGDEAAHLGHQHDQRDLAHVGRFAGHVRAGDDRDAAALRAEVRVVRHEQRIL